MIGAQDEGTTIPEAVAMEAATVETEATESVGEVATATAPPRVGYYGSPRGECGRAS
jgi:hypothetical protein